MSYEGIQAVTDALDMNAEGYPDITILREEIVGEARVFLVQGGTLAPGRQKWIGATSIAMSASAAECASAIRQDLLNDSIPG